VATFLPTSKADSSVCVIVPLPMSFSRLSIPTFRLSPLVSSSVCCAFGLSARKLAGDAASTHCDTANLTRFRVF
jgi:hypothetical protein